MPSAEEAAADCPYINEYCREKHQSVVKCYWTPNKGRILRSERPFKQGEIIFREPPLHIVAEHKGNAAFERLQELCDKQSRVFEYEPLWYWAALSSLKPSLLPSTATELKAVDEDQHRKLLLLYHEEVPEASEACKILVKELQLEPACQALQVERLLQVWILNCFEHSDEPLGYSTYFMSSFMSHSCYPNAVWHYDGDDFVLRARCDIEANDEVTVSYLSEDTLLESTASRRRHLKDSKHFVCDCVRCTAKEDPGRGFRCPFCSAVSLAFGPADGDKVDVGVEEMTSRTCERCDKSLGQGEAAMLHSEEKLLESKIEATERGIAKNGVHSKHRDLLLQLEKDVQRAEKSLSQHWLLDKAWQLVGDLQARNGRPQDAETTMRKRLEFQAKAYPGLSGTNAWTLEAYADMLLRHQRCTLEPEISVPDEKAAKQLAPNAQRVYAESLRILQFMFGVHHEYYSGVRRKAERLDQELARYGFGRSS